MIDLPRGVRRLFHLEPTERQVESDVDAELAFHLEQRVAALQARGLPLEEARAEALRQFGDMRTHRLALVQSDLGTVHQRQRRDWRGDWRSDVLFGARSLARTPGVTAAIVLMLALGIGANAAMFGILDRLFIRPPAHIRDPGTLHRVYVREKSYFGDVLTMARMEWPDFTALRADSQRLSGVAGYTGPAVTTLGIGQASEDVRVSWVTGDFFHLLGVGPAIGRVLGPADDQDSAAPVAVIGDGYWQRRFARSRDALGATATFDNTTFTIVGVAPPGFSGPDPNAADFWLPLQPAVLAGRGPRWRQSGSGFSLTPLARLAPGVSPEVANAAATVALRVARSGATYRDTLPTVLIGPLLATRGPDGAGQAMLLPLVVGGVALVVLLIATANVANLLLLRTAGRRRELAVRLALGAGRWRIGRMLVIESLLLALLAGTAAAGVSAVSGRLLRVTLLPRESWPGGVTDWSVLGFAALAALLVGLCTGLVAASQAMRSGGLDDLRSGTRSAGSTRSPVRTTLLVVQSALSLVLLIGAGVFYRSFDAARGLDIGYMKDRLLTVNVSKAHGRDRTPLDEASMTELGNRLRAIPGVSDVAMATNSPMNSATASSFGVRGVDSLPRMNGPYGNYVTTNFHDVTGLAITSGRGFTPADEGGPRVALVNTELARLVWRDQQPIGACLYLDYESTECTTVVGVVESSREFGLQDSDMMPQYYGLLSRADTSLTSRSRSFVVRTTGDPESVAPAALRALAELFPELPRSRVRSLRAVFGPRIRTWRVGTALFGAAAALALLLAAIGLYAVIAFGVRQREFEFGIRRALGAQVGDLVRLMLFQGFAIAAAGVMAGVALSLWAGRFVAPLLFANRSPLDWPAFAVAVAVLLGVALAASLMPARGVGRVHPARALKAE